MMTKYYRVTSDNFDNVVMDEASYKELTLQMSSGDFGSHTAELIPQVSAADLVDLVYFDLEFNEFVQA